MGGWNIFRGWSDPLGRVAYLAWGAGLFAVKYGLDSAIAWFGFGRPWLPWSYLTWPAGGEEIFALEADERWMALAMLVASLPFILVGVQLTLRRLVSAGLPAWLVFVFFLPVLNWIFFALLSVLPPRPERYAAMTGTRTAGDGPGEAEKGESDAGPDDDDASAAYRPPAAEAIPVESAAGSPFAANPFAATLGLTDEQRRQADAMAARNQEGEAAEAIIWGVGAVMATTAIVLAMLVTGVYLLQSYGVGLFVAAPFGAGLFSVVIFGLRRRRPFWGCLLVVFATTAVAGAATLALAMEGAICLVMASPIILVVVIFGGLVGYLIQLRPWLMIEPARVPLTCLAVVPAVMLGEAAAPDAVPIREVRTAVTVDAPPEVVWERVVGFPPLPAVEEPLFLTGIAAPLSAEIDGTGVGAVRQCHFTTGTFVEPITVWDAPRRLAFDVTAQPAPMREWSYTEIHPPHLHGFLVSRRGEFRLVALPDGRTRLVGTTWYSNDMAPQAYWGTWSDWIIHRVHERVLTHVRELAEADVAGR